MHTRKSIEYRAMNLENLPREEYYHLEDAGMLYEYFPEATGSYDNDMESVSRIDNIGQNGNEGLHYRVPFSDNPDGVEWPHRHEDGYAEKIEALYEPPKDGMFVDDYNPVPLDKDKINDAVNQPSHYEIGNTGIEAIDVIQATLTEEQYIGYLRGNILKYQLRANKKNGTEDLNKADIYSGWLMEVLEE